MRKSFFIVKLLALIILMSSCASSYKSINPSSLYYNAHELKDGIGLSYKYDVLRENGNKKYAKKEFKKNIKIVALKVTNNTSSSIVIGQNAMIYVNEYPIIPMSTQEIKMEIGQSTPLYLLYLLLTPLKLYIKNGNSFDSPTETYPIGYLLGPGLAIGNIGVASASNASFKRELDFNNLVGREIKVGESVYGLIGIRDFSYNQISIRLNN
jgi:hypothetical protein